MNKLISDHLQSIIDTEVIPKYTLDKGHVFYSIHNRLSGKVSIEEKMNIFYHFEEIKKILGQARREQLNLARLTLNGLERHELKYSNKIADLGMQSIHLPMLAYLDYAHSDFDKAEARLKKSIELLKQLVLEDIEDCKVAALEQYFNLFKVYLNVNKPEEAASIALQIVRHVTGKPSDLFDFSTEQGDDLKEQLNVLHYYINGVFKVLLVNSRKDTPESVAVKKEVLSRLSDDLKNLDLNFEPIPFLREMLLSVVLTDKRFENIYDEIPLENLFHPVVPSVIQFLILQRYVDQHLKSQDPTVALEEMAISKAYSKNVLATIL